MDVNDDFADILASLVAEQAEFLVVGAYALAAHGFPRMTGDIDIFVRPTVKNASRVYRALLAFGAPVSQHGRLNLTLAENMATDEEFARWQRVGWDVRSLSRGMAPDGSPQCR